jgi:hypothetical protein
MTAPADRRRPERELSDSEFLGWAARSITESTEQIRDALERILAEDSSYEGVREQLAALA